jgi:hypothetical protein
MNTHQKPQIYLEIIISQSKHLFLAGFYLSKGRDRRDGGDRPACNPHPAG